MVRDFGVWPHYDTFILDSRGDNASASVVGGIRHLEEALGGAERLRRASIDLAEMRRCLRDRGEIAGLEPLSFTVTLEAGDVLFIPLGWWHEVRGLTPSISLSATNFRARNDFYQTYEFFGGLK